VLVNDMLTTIDNLIALLKETGGAHHQAFLASDGADPDWPIWYAEHLTPKLAERLDVDLTKGELVKLLLALEQEHAARGTDEAWVPFYARQIHERFVVEQKETLSLYHFDSCPFCRLVRTAIDELGANVELRDVMAEPKWRQELVAARGRGTVPVLRCESEGGRIRWMPESRDIIRHLRSRFG
jgi:glutaredoxin